MNIIVTINLNNETNFKKVNSPIESIRTAANRWNSDFFELGDLKYKEYNKSILRNAGGWNGFTGTKIWQLIWILENFKNYNKVLILDTDIFINSEAPNIFQLIDDDYDVSAVLDGNPGRLNNRLYNNSINLFSKLNGCVEYLKYLDNFNIDDYTNNYINTGVLLFNNNRFKDKIENLKWQILNKEKIFNYIESHDSPIDQNLMSAWISSNKDINLNIIDNTWNWISPDIIEEYDEFLGKMPKMIYHFCGTNLIKERIETYDRWR